MAAASSHLHIGSNQDNQSNLIVKAFFLRLLRVLSHVWSILGDISLSKEVVHVNALYRVHDVCALSISLLVNGLGMPAIVIRVVCKYIGPL